MSIKSKSVIVNISLEECLKTAANWLVKAGHRKVDIEKDNDETAIELIEFE